MSIQSSVLESVSPPTGRPWNDTEHTCTGLFTWEVGQGGGCRPMKFAGEHSLFVFFLRSGVFPRQAGLVEDPPPPGSYKASWKSMPSLGGITLSLKEGCRPILKTKRSAPLHLQSKMSTRNIWVGNLPPSTNQVSLTELFSQFGIVESCKVCFMQGPVSVAFL